VCTYPHHYANIPPPAAAATFVGGLYGANRVCGPAAGVRHQRVQQGRGKGGSEWRGGERGMLARADQLRAFVVCNIKGASFSVILVLFFYLQNGLYLIKEEIELLLYIYYLDVVLWMI
jgi:hypothetical protein